MVSHHAGRNGWFTLAAGIALLAAGTVATFWNARSVHPNYVVRDPLLHARGVVVYRATAPARALVVFFGNDVGFWRPHHALAAELASRGYDVAGVDIRPLFASLPEGHPARDSACVVAVREIVAHVRRELDLDSVPLIIAGHSLGAELALWIVGNGGVRGVAGVLALSPGSRSHLRISASDLLMTSEPQGPDSFGVADAVDRVRTEGIRIAIVRGSHDKFAAADPMLLAAGGPLIRRFAVPLASHSLRDLTLARYIIRDAVDWLLESTRSHHVARTTISSPVAMRD